MNPSVTRDVDRIGVVDGRCGNAAVEIVPWRWGDTRCVVGCGIRVMSCLPFGRVKDIRWEDGDEDTCCMRWRQVFR